MTSKNTLALQPWPTPAVALDSINCAVYLRISKDKTNTADGVRRHEKMALKECERRGWNPIVYMDNDTPASEGSGPRDAFMRLLGDMDAGRIQVVWVHMQSRLVRDRDEYWPMFAKLARAQNIILITGNNNSEIDFANYSDRHSATAQANDDTREIDILRDRLSVFFNDMDGRAWWPTRPFGYTRPKATDLDDDGERIVPTTVPEEAALIEQAYHDVIAKRSLRAIARDWNEKGVRTPTTKRSKETLAKNPRRGGGNEWSPLAVRALLLNPRNAGLRERCHTEKRAGKTVIVSRTIDESVKTEWPAIIDVDIWRGAVAILRSRTKNPNAWSRKYLLSGLAICGRCAADGKPNQRMNVHVGNSEKTPGYYCPACNGCRRSMVMVDALVKGQVIKDVFDADIIERLTDDGGVEIEKLLARLAVLEGIRAEQRQAITERLFTVAEMRADIAKIAAEIADIESQVATAQVDRTGALRKLLEAKDRGCTPAEVADIFNGMELDERRAAVDLLYSVTIRPGQAGGRAPFDASLVEVELRV